MRRLITTLFMLVIAVTPAFAGQIWTDGNGDGLPDPPNQNFHLEPSQLITIDVWVDSQSYNWTNYQAYIETAPGCLNFINGVYVVAGGNNFPIDTSTNPRAVGLGGFGFAGHGQTLLGRLTYHYNGPDKCCLIPIIDIYNQYGTFSILATATSYFLFQTANGTCVERPPSATEPTTWGAIKGIYQ